MSGRVDLIVTALVMGLLSVAALSVAHGLSGIGGMAFIAVTVLSVAIAFRITKPAPKSVGLRPIKSILNAISLPILLVDAEGRVVFGNMAARELLEHTAESFAGLPLRSVLPEDLPALRSDGRRGETRMLFGSGLVEAKARLGGKVSVTVQQTSVRYAGASFRLVELGRASTVPDEPAHHSALARKQLDLVFPPEKLRSQHGS